jgi:hypothetical protein
MVLALRSPVYLGFDAVTLSGAVLSRGFGRRRLKAFETAPLPAGVLNPSPVSRNVLRPAELGEALSRLRARLGRTGPATLVLPEGTARLVLLDVNGESLRDYARFRLAAGLPYPLDEAVVDVLRVGSGRALAAAVRRAVVEEYEAAAAAAGFERERVDLAPFVGIAGLLGRGERSPRVHALLGESAMSLAAVDGSGLAAFRQRRRDPGPGEPERLAAEAARTARLLGNGGDFQLSVSGSGASRIGEELASSGLAVEVSSAAVDAPGGEAAWLAGLLA